MKSPENFEKEKQIIIESAKPEDAVGIAQVRDETWRATHPEISKEDFDSKNYQSEKQIRAWKNAIEDEKSARKIWVAKEGNAVVGYSQGFEGKEENEIWGLYVLPNFQNKGLGSKLLKEALDWLDDNKNIILEVARDNTDAINLYKKFGFEKADEHVEGTSFASGATIPSIKMIRPGK